MAKSLVALVGTKFRGPEMVALLASLPNGEPLTLVRDPANEYDPNAIKVFAREQHIGFVKGSQAKALAAFMDNPARPQMGTPDFKLSGVTVPGMRVAAPIHGKLAIDGGKQPMVEIDGE
jgi:hypothetical protein